MGKEGLGGSGKTFIFEGSTHVWSYNLNEIGPQLILSPQQPEEKNTYPVNNDPEVTGPSFLSPRPPPPFLPRKRDPWT